MLRDTIDTLAPVATAGIDSFASDPGILWVRMAPGDEATAFTLYDGGVIEQKTHGAEITFEPGTKFTKGALFEIIARTDKPISIRNAMGMLMTERGSRAALDATADGWFWDPAPGGTLWIKVAPGAAAILIDG